MPANLTPSDADYVRDLLRRRAAIDLDASKLYLLEQRLEQLARDGGFESVKQIVEQSKNGAPSVDKQIIEAMTTHETLFFRDVHPFEILRRNVLPALIAARERTRSLTVWSAACSSGQEPYSIAMSLLEHFSAAAEWPVRIVATDISDKVLARAREGRFQQLEVNRGLPASMLIKYFDRVGMEWQIKERVRNLVEFRKLNLLDPWNGLRPDIVFIRNVLIYFDLNNKRAILNRIGQAIAPDGVMFLGGAETTFNIDDRWERVSVEKSAYYRVKR
ncbi:MAG TPA: protein-glutamate O-methyltransferase CheR [Polyangiaceae bacterium]|nr:protein-glutamate O-methyltransferase CheR [Polyangiaceae bacterium]